MKSLLALTLFTVNVELFVLLDAPVTVIKSYWLYVPKLTVAVSELLILYSVPVLVKLITVPDLSALWFLSDNMLVLVCAIVVIYSVFFLLNLAVFGPSPYTAANSFGSCPSTVKMLMYLIL